MAEPYVGEVRHWAGRFAPQGWALCDGRLLAIAEHDELFNLIGTTFGGDGQSTFQLPDLQGRVPVHMGNGLVLGQPGGVESVTLTTDEIPSHSHAFMGSTDPATVNTVTNSVPASLPAAGTIRGFSSEEPIRAISPSSLGPSGEGQDNTNVQPYLAITFIIALEGLWPYQPEEETSDE